MTQHNTIKLFEAKKSVLFGTTKMKMVLFHSGCGGCPNR